MVSIQLFLINNHFNSKNVVFYFPGMQWCGTNQLGQRFMAEIEDNDVITEILQQLELVIDGRI